MEEKAKEYRESKGISNIIHDTSGARTFLFEDELVDFAQTVLTEMQSEYDAADIIIQEQHKELYKLKEENERLNLRLNDLKEFNCKNQTELDKAKGVMIIVSDLFNGGIKTPEDHNELMSYLELLKE